MVVPLGYDSSHTGDSWGPSAHCEALSQGSSFTLHFRHDRRGLEVEAKASEGESAPWSQQVMSTELESLGGLSLWGE